MIELGQTRAMLLAAIGPADPANEPLRDILDPCNPSSDACLRASGNGQADLFSLLKVALVERFAAVPRTQFLRDLLIPLRNALGNAFKHGNREDPTKAISVEIVLAQKGALIAITDEGPGFDAALTFQRFQRRENYFECHGCGFRNLHRARSTISYENGGRTILLCFQPTRRDQDHASSSPASVRDSTFDRGEASGDQVSHESGGSRREEAHCKKSEIRNPKSEIDQSLLRSAATTSNKFTFRAHDLEAAEALPKVLDAAWLQTCLSAELPEFANGQASLESCRGYATSGPADCGNRYVLRVNGRNGEPAETRVLTGRLHATEAAAAADFEGAARLREANISKHLLIPRPVARLGGEPRLVLHDFDPWMNLWEFLTYRSRLKSLRHRAEHVGQMLARLHRSGIALRLAESDFAGEQLPAIIMRTESSLQTLLCGGQTVERFRACVRRLPERPAFRQQRILAPIHGSFGWDCIHYGVDGHFYLHRFERCRRSDPGLDLGGFTADLLCFTLANHDETVYRTCRDVFLDHYNTNSEHPMDAEDLRFYIVLALVERLQRAESPASVAPWLDALEAAIGNRDLESEVA